MREEEKIRKDRMREEEKIRKDRMREEEKIREEIINRTNQFNKIIKDLHRVKQYIDDRETLDILLSSINDYINLKELNLNDNILTNIYKLLHNMPLKKYFTDKDREQILNIFTSP
jgi:hypothetical protein